jgi:hypothetical protein
VKGGCGSSASPIFTFVPDPAVVCGRDNRGRCASDGWFAEALGSSNISVEASDATQVGSAFTLPMRR